MNSIKRIINGKNPFIIFPGRRESGLVGSPKKYLNGPDFVTNQDTTNDPKVARIRTTGKDPEENEINILEADVC